MTDAEKRALLDKLEGYCWEAMHNLPSAAWPQMLRDLLTSIEIIKEMRYDYQEDDDEEDEG